MEKFYHYINVSLAALVSVYVMCYIDLNKQSKNNQAIILLVWSIYNILCFISVIILPHIKQHGERFFMQHVRNAYIISTGIHSLIELLAGLQQLNDIAMSISSIIAFQFLINCWYFEKDLSGFVTGVVTGFLEVSMSNFFNTDAKAIHVLLPFGVFLVALVTQ
ncbi:hypothetical protein MKW92_014095, partial [Papaver armeniacum]